MSVVKLHKTVGVKVGRVQVGGGAPIVVQSMTMTDTADARGDRAAVHRAGRGRIGDGARHRQPARSGGGRARDQAADARRRLHGAAHRRLPLQRPPAADASFPTARAALDKYRINPGQRRHRQAARRAVLDDLQGGGRSRQAGAHRRQRRLAQPGARRREDAGEHRPQSRQDVRGDHQRVHGAVGGRVDGARASRAGCARIRSSSRARRRGRAISSPSIARSRGRPISRCTSG